MLGIMNIPNHVEIDEMEELQMLEKAVASLASQKLGWKDDLARARISVKMTQVWFESFSDSNRSKMKHFFESLFFISRSWCYIAYQKRTKKSWEIAWTKLTMMQMQYWVYGSSPLDEVPNESYHMIHDMISNNAIPISKMDLIFFTIKIKL